MKRQGESGLDLLARVLHASPGFLRARLREARAEIESLNAQVAERDEIIRSLLAQGDEEEPRA